MTHSNIRRPIHFALCLVMAPLFCLALAPAASAAAPSPGAAFSDLAVTPLVVEAQKKGKGYNRGNYGPKAYRGRGYGRRGKVRSWSRKPHYGQFFAGVTLGTLLGVAVAGAAPPPPGPGLCWYWTDPYMTYGYWDYCY